MIVLFSINLFFGVLIKIIPPKKPNYLYGYQLGSAKKSVAHWNVANRIASNYIIFLYSFLIVLSLLFDYLKYDGAIICLIINTIALISVYLLIEKKLKYLIT